jgi:hypothetical protein
MQIELTIKDLVALAAHSKVEKDGIIIIISRPILTKITTGRESKAEVLFFLDDSDGRSKDQF